MAGREKMVRRSSRCLSLHDVYLEEASGIGRQSRQTRKAKLSDAAKYAINVCMYVCMYAFVRPCTRVSDVLKKSR